MRVVCPRCGAVGTLIRQVTHGRPYMYVRHRENGKIYAHCIYQYLDQSLTVLPCSYISLNRSLICYEGSDTKLVPFLLQLIPPHRCYVEVFGGGAALLIHKSPSRVEVYNDIDAELVNMFMCIANKECVKKMIEACKQLPFSRLVLDKTLAHELKVLPPSPDPYYAALTLYKLRGQYLGKHRGGFAVSKERNHAADWQSITRGLRKYYMRLRKVVFEYKDFRDLIRIYDGHETFFYCDPPHHNAPALDTYYKHSSWTEKDFHDLLNILKNIKGKFLLKYRWDESVEDAIRSCGFNYIVVKHTLHGKKTINEKRDTGKLIFAMNYKPSRIEAKGAVRTIVKVVVNNY